MQGGVDDEYPPMIVTPAPSSPDEAATAPLHRLWQGTVATRVVTESSQVRGEKQGGPLVVMFVSLCVFFNVM